MLDVCSVQRRLSLLPSTNNKLTVSSSEPFHLENVMALSLCLRRSACAWADTALKNIRTSSSAKRPMEDGSERCIRISWTRRSGCVHLFENMGGISLGSDVVLGHSQKTSS